MALTFQAKGIYNSKNNTTLQKGKKYETFFVSKLLNWRQKWVTDIRLVVCWVSPGKRIVVLFWTKYAVHRQIKPGILNLILRRGQFNFSIVYIFISFEENGNFRVVLVEQLSFDCRSYCGRSHRMQGLPGELVLATIRPVQTKGFIFHPTLAGSTNRHHFEFVKSNLNDSASTFQVSPETLHMRSLWPSFYMKTIYFRKWGRNMEAKTKSIV